MMTILESSVDLSDIYRAGKLVRQAEWTLKTIYDLQFDCYDSQRLARLDRIGHRAERRCTRREQRSNDLIAQYEAAMDSAPGI